MPGIRLVDVRAALAALGLAGLAALAVAITTHLPMPAPQRAGGAREQRGPQPASVAAPPCAVGHLLDHRRRQPRLRRAAHRLRVGPQRWRRPGRLPCGRSGDAHRWRRALAVARGRPRSDLGHRARQPGHAHAPRHPGVVRRGAARDRAGLRAVPPPRRRDGPGLTLPSPSTEGCARGPRGPT